MIADWDTDTSQDHRKGIEVQDTLKLIKINRPEFWFYQRNSFFSKVLFWGLFCDLNLFAGFQKSFSRRGIRYLISSCDLLLNLLKTGLLVIRTWWICEAQTLIYLVVLVYPIKTPFYILHISDFECFFAIIYVFTLLPKMWICFIFCLMVI